MKTILVTFLCITSSMCGVIKDDLNTPSYVECRRFEVHLARVTDFFEDGNVTLLKEILIDVTKDQEGRPTNIESVTKNYHLSPGMHKWEIKFLSSAQSVDEINRVVSIVENAAKKKGQLVSKNCTTEDNTVICHFNINVDVTSQPLSKKHKRDTEFQNNAQPTNVEHHRFEIHLARVTDFFEHENITLLTEILIDVTKDQEGRPTNIESVTKNYHLSPGMHKWEIKFLSSAQPVDEISRVVSIVENAAKKTGQLVDKNCTTEDNMVTCHFNINVDATSQPLSKKHKRDIEFQNNTQPTDIEEIKRLLDLVEAAENKNGESDGKNCTTTEGVVICNVYIPNDPSRIHKREIEFQNNTTPTDEDEIKEKPDIVNAAANSTNIVDDNGNICTETVTVDNKVYCPFSTSAALVGGCPSGTDRADDNTCVPIVE